MNAFLVNVLLFNLWGISLTHFCTIAFAEYARLTDIDLIFGIQIKHMAFFKYFWENNVFIYILIVK
jgi:LMBR1 domain-containing protein 1